MSDRCSKGFINNNSALYMLSFPCIMFTHLYEFLLRICCAQIVNLLLYKELTTLEMMI